MRAARCHRFGAPEVVQLEDTPIPVAGSGQVVVDVDAASVNFPDVLLVSGGYQARPDLPFTVGSEAAGVVSQVGPGVTGFGLGDAVFGVCGLGAFAEKVVMSADELRRTPAGVDAAAAATFSIAYETAYHALRTTAGVQPGETVVVLGAAGGVGSAAVQCAVRLGARVIAAASSAQRLALCTELGASATVDYEHEDLKTRLKELAPDGVDVVIDPVGGAHSEAALRATTYGARFVVVGFAAGQIPRIPLNLVLLKGVSIRGFDMRTFAAREPEMNARDNAELMALLAQGQLRPHVSAEYPLERVSDALRDVAERKIAGKAVIRVRPILPPSPVS